MCTLAHLNDSPRLAVMTQIATAHHGPAMQRNIGGSGGGDLQPGLTDKTSRKLEHERDGRVGVGL